MIVRKYITKSELHDGDVKTQRALRYSNIPPETEVTFVEEWTNFYGNWVRVKYEGRIYDVRPFDIFIREITKEVLTEPQPNCCTMFKNSEVILIGKLNLTDNRNNIIESDIWLSKNSDGIIIPVDIKMCKSFYFISSVVDKPFKFNNDLNCKW